MLLAAVVLSILVYGVISSMLGSLLPTLGFTGEQNGTLALTQALGLAVASLSAGPLIDTRGKKTGMVSGLAGIATSLWLLPNAGGDFAMAAPLWFLLGLGGGLMVTSANALVSDIGGVRRSSILNSTNLFFGLGLMITPYLASNVFSGDVRGLCYFGAALATGMLALQASIRMPLPNPDQRFSWAEVGGLLRSPALRLFAAFAFLYVSCEVGMSNWLVKYLIAGGMSKGVALKILSLGFAGGLLSGRVIASRVLMRVPAANVAVAAAIAMALTTLWAIHAGGGVRGTAAAVFCTGLAMAPAYPTTLGMVGDRFPAATGTAMGLVITAGWAGLAWSSWLIGAIAGSDESHLATALWLFPFFSLAMIGISLAMRSTMRFEASTRSAIDSRRH